MSFTMHWYIMQLACFVLWLSINARAALGLIYFSKLGQKLTVQLQAWSNVCALRMPCHRQVNWANKDRAIISNTYFNLYSNFDKSSWGDLPIWSIARESDRAWANYDLLTYSVLLGRINVASPHTCCACILSASVSMTQMSVNSAIRN